MSGVVDPDVDALEMMQGETQNSVDLFGVPYVAGERYCAFGKSDARPSCLRSCGVAGEQHHARTFTAESLRNRLPDAHRSARDYDDLPVQFHVRVVFSTTLQVKVTVECCRTIKQH